MKGHIPNSKEDTKLPIKLEKRSTYFWAIPIFSALIVVLTIFNLFQTKR